MSELKAVYDVGIVDNGHQPAAPVQYRDFRCNAPGCGRLLFRGVFLPGCEISIRCPKCGMMHSWQFVFPTGAARASRVAIVVPDEPEQPEQAENVPFDKIE